MLIYSRFLHQSKDFKLLLVITISIIQALLILIYWKIIYAGYATVKLLKYLNMILKPILVLLKR